MFSKSLLTAIAFTVAVSFFGSVPTIAMAQERIEVAQATTPKKRSLFDVLFGRNKPVEKKTTKKTTSRSITTVAKIKTIEKAPDAKRLLVLGDSLAVDLAKSLDRFYAEDSELAIVAKGVGSSGFVRDDYFDWNKTIREYLETEQFDLVVVAIGINDRQQIKASDGRHEPLTDGWRTEYSARIDDFLQVLKDNQKPVIWMGLPPMRKNSYSKAMAQITSLHRLSTFSNGADYVDIYERFLDEDGNYTSYGPDLNGQNALMRKTDGIHLAAAGSDKVSFFVDKLVKQYYRGGQISIAIVDPLAQSDAASMLRPPFQGIAQIRRLEFAGAVRALGEQKRSTGGLVLAVKSTTPLIDLETLFDAPAGRVDAFGVGRVDEETEEEIQK